MDDKKICKADFLKSPKTIDNGADVPNAARTDPSSSRPGRTNKFNMFQQSAGGSGQSSVDNTICLANVISLVCNKDELDLQLA